MKFDLSKDLIGIIAPASKIKNVEEKLEVVCKILAANGFKYIVADRIFEKEALPFFAASYANRVSGLKEMLENPEIKIVLPIMGGYGCTEIIFEFLNAKLETPKTLIGFSDITALHVLFNQQFKVPTIHGAVYSPFFDIDSSSAIIDILKGEDIKFVLKPINNSTSKGEISGKMMGGNLTVFCNMIGTPLAPKTKGKILVFEDVNEKAYQVHRHLVHLKNAKLFDKVKAVIFGDFTKSDEHVEAALENFCKFHIPHIPTFKLENIGHGKVNTPFILGHKASIIGNDFKQESPFSLK